MSLKLGPLMKVFKDESLIVTPRLQMWMLQHGDEPLPEWVLDKIREQLATTPRDRSRSFSASAFGTCHRAQILKYLGIKEAGAIDPQLANIFNDGKWRHLRLQAAMLAAGIIMEIEFPLDWPAMRARGTVDAMGVVPDNHPHVSWRGKEFGVEIKGVSTFQFGSYVGNDPNDKHQGQGANYQMMSGWELFVFLYEDKTTQAWLEWVVEPDPEQVAHARRELERLNRRVDRKSLPPMLDGCRTRKGPEWKECPYAGKQGPCVMTQEWPAKALSSP